MLNAFPVSEVRADLLVGRDQQPSVIAVRDADKHAHIRPGQPSGRDAGMFQRFPSHFEQQTMLRVHVDRLARGDAEKLRVEAVHVLDVTGLRSAQSIRLRWPNAPGGFRSPCRGHRAVRSKTRPANPRRETGSRSRRWRLDRRRWPCATRFDYPSLVTLGLEPVCGPPSEWSGHRTTTGGRKRAAKPSFQLAGHDDRRDRIESVADERAGDFDLLASHTQLPGNTGHQPLLDFVLARRVRTAAVWWQLRNHFGRRQLAPDSVSGFMLPLRHDLKLVGQELAAAFKTLDFAARGLGKRCGLQQHNGVNFQVEMFGNRMPNAFDDCVKIDTFELPLDLVRHDQTLIAISINDESSATTPIAARDGFPQPRAPLSCG